MKILLIHNQYQQRGGEDAVFEAERALLEENGHGVESLVYNNAVIRSFSDKCVYGLRTLYNPSSAADLRLKIHDFKPDVIHVHNFLPQASPAVFVVARQSRIPVVLTLHNYRLLCPSATLFHKGKIYERSLQSFFPFDAIRRSVYRDSMLQTFIVALMTTIHKVLGTWKKSVDGYVCLTQFARKKFEQSSLAIPAYKLFVKSNFVKDSGYDPVDRQDFFLFVGRLSEEKGIRLLLKAATAGNFPLVIIGDGPLRKTVEDAAADHANITYLGFQSGPRVMGYLKTCRSLIFPSIWYEGFPVTIAEAFSVGTPVIASYLGSMIEIINNGVNGLHFRAGDEGDLIAMTRMLSSSESLRKTLSANARKTYLLNYTPEKNYGMLMNLYETVIQRRAMSTRSRAVALPQVSLAG